ncbi:MAG: protein-L-isoaspartate O-methyltransferase [Patescibacteria group bacterium]
MITTGEDLVNGLINWGELKNPLLVKALRRIDRKFFVPVKLQDEAYGNYPLPIGKGQTISQPSTVVFMIEQLKVKPGQSILEVGSGGGWVSALLAQMVGDQGHVTGMDIIPELVELARENIRRVIASPSKGESEAISFKNLQFIVGDGSLGYKKNSSYDRIIVSAGARKIPQALLKQLKDGGRMVIPVGEGTQDMVVIEKVGTKIKQTKYSGFVFVPLISK